MNEPLRSEGSAEGSGLRVYGLHPLRSFCLILPVGVITSGTIAFITRFLGYPTALSVAATAVISMLMLLGAGFLAARTRKSRHFLSGAIASWPFALTWNVFVAADVFHAHGQSLIRTMITLVIYLAAAAAIGGIGGCLAFIFRCRLNPAQKL